tara:strand:- start:137 stop:508 length:372 start_codon:yes stop_codon:yes gene_type:complete
MSDTKDINEVVEKALEEYYSITGISLPTGTGVPYKDIGPFSQYVRSAADILDRILDIVNDDVADLDKLDVQEFLYVSVPRLQNKIDTLCTAIERKTGFKSMDKTRAKPLTPPSERKNKKIKIK